MLGRQSSPAFLRVPEGNGCAERFIRTLNENLSWIRTLDTTEEVQPASLALRDTYNATWLIQRLDHRSDAQVRQQQLPTIAIAA